MPLNFVKHQPVSLKESPEFSERWLQDMIANDASILGLGDVEVIARERVIERSGRLDLLLSDGDSTRYEVELMLGATDPSHIIRCIEYWDAERRRYPGYEHIAVLVAEDITARFLNVISLMAGNIPMIAIQLSALQVGDSLVLNFVEVLNQTQLRRDDSDGGNGPEVDRAYWESKSSPNIMKIADGVLSLVNEVSESPFVLKHLKGHVAIAAPNDWKNFLVMWPKKKHLNVSIRVDEVDEWVSKFDEAGVPAQKSRRGRLRLVFDSKTLEGPSEIVKQVLTAALAEFNKA